MRKQVLLILALIVLPVTPSAVAKDALEKPNEEKRELLANHDTLAVFDGVNYVFLSWHHDYVTKEGTSSPERPIVKLEKINADKAKELLDAPAAKEATEATMKETTTLDITTKKPADQIKMTIDKDIATLDVSSQSGIGSATITLAKGKWPTTVVLRLHLGGLESFAVSNGKIKLMGSVLSHSGNTKRLHLTGRDGERESGTEIKVLDAAGKPVKGLPDKGGYFEITLPKALLKGEPKSLELGWIDFYRG